MGVESMLLCSETVCMQCRQTVLKLLHCQVLAKMEGFSTTWLLHLKRQQKCTAMQMQDPDVSFPLQYD